LGAQDLKAAKYSDLLAVKIGLNLVADMATDSFAFLLAGVAPIGTALAERPVLALSRRRGRQQCSAAHGWQSGDLFEETLALTFEDWGCGHEGSPG